MVRGRFGLDNRFMIRTSRSNRAAFLSASVSDTSSPDRRRRITFTATVSAVSRSRARYTSPMFPRACGPRISNRPAMTSAPLMTAFFQFVWPLMPSELTRAPAKGLHS